MFASLLSALADSDFTATLLSFFTEGWSWGG